MSDLMEEILKEQELFIPWHLLSEEQQKEMRALPLSRRWEYHRDNKKWIRECKEYRQKNPYQCFTVKLIMANK